MKTKKVRPVLVETKILKDNEIYPAKIVMENNKLFNCYSCKYSYEKAKFFELILISLVAYKGIEYRTKYYNSASKKIEICQSLSELNDFCFKVIATQEQIPLEYINHFIKEYNQNDVKDIEIDIEYDLICKPKLTNGFVNIVKNSTNIDSNKQHNLYCNMQYCKMRKYVTPQEWIEKHKHYTDKKEQITYTEEEVYKMCKTSFEMHMTNEYSDDELIEIFKVWFNENKKNN